MLAIWRMFASAPLPESMSLSETLPPTNSPEGMSLFQIQTGVNHRTAAFAYRGGSFFDKRDFVATAILLMHPKGDLLIDTGFGRNVRDQFKNMPSFFRLATNFDPGQSAADQLDQVGYDKRNLRAILLTHAHWDHVSGVPDFPTTPIWITKEEHDFVRDGGWITNLMRSFADVNYQEYTFDGGAYLGFPKSHDLYSDGSIIIVPAFGHTPGSVVIFITLPGGQRFALIGDLSWQLEGIQKREERPWIQRMLGDDDPNELRTNLIRMNAISTQFPQIIVVPAHDPKGFSQIPLINTWRPRK